MLCTKFQPTISSGPGEKIDFSGLTIFSNSVHSRFPTSLNFIIIKPCYVVMLHVKFENHGCSSFRE